MLNFPTFPNMPPYRYSGQPMLATPAYRPMDRVYSPVAYPAANNPQNNDNGDSYTSTGQTNHCSFVHNHQGVCNSLADAGRHYLVDAAPQMLDYMPSFTQMGTMWLRSLHDHQDQADARSLPRPTLDAARTMATNMVEGIGRFFL